MNLEGSLERQKLNALGINDRQLADSTTILLPENTFTSRRRRDLYDSGEARHLAKLLREAGVECATLFDFGLDVPILERRSKDTRLGIIWIRDTVVLPLIISVLGTVIAEDIHDAQKDRVEATVHVEFYLEKDRNITKISYKGDRETLLKVLKAIESPTSR
jgi:hypothetical protein